MRKYEFVFLDRQKLDAYLPVLFRILHSNMNLIASTNNSYNDDYEIWCACIVPAMQKEQRQMVLMYAESKLAGYFQYYINANTNSFMMEEIQIKKEFQGTGLFSEFYKWLIQQLPQDISYVEAYALKQNHKSQAILKHLGLIQSGENKNGNCFYFKGQYAELMGKYS